MDLKLKYFKKYNDVKDPKFGTEQAACFDVHAYFGSNEACLINVYDKDNNNIKYLAGKATHLDNVKFVNLNPGDRALIPTGLIFDIPKGYSVRVHSRSGNALKLGLVLANSEGVIDSDYFHETFIMILNTSNKIVKINHDDRIAQLEMIPVLAYDIEQTDTPPAQKSDRVGGFGSIGK